MEDIEIEYLDEYKDIVLPGIKTNEGRAAPATSTSSQASLRYSRQRRLSSDSSGSSSIDADIFKKLFAGKPFNDELTNISSSSRLQRRSSSTSSDDLALMQPVKPSNKLPANTVKRAPKTVSNRGNTSGAKNKTDSFLESKKQKSITIIKANKANLKPGKNEPKNDPLNLQELEDDTDNFYDSESDDGMLRDSRQVIDISTDTNTNTTIVSDTVTPVVSEDETQQQQQEWRQEQLLSYLNNLSSAETPPSHEKYIQNRNRDSNEHKSTSSSKRKQVKSSTSPKKHSVPDEKQPSEKSHSKRRLFDGSDKSLDGLDFVDDNLTYETVERSSLNIAEEINNIDAELQSRSGSKPRSISSTRTSSKSLNKKHVRKLTYSNEHLHKDKELMQKTEQRNAESDSGCHKRKRGRPPKIKAARSVSVDNQMLITQQPPQTESNFPNDNLKEEEKKAPEKDLVVEQQTDTKTEDTKQLNIIIDKPKRRGRPPKIKKTTHSEQLTHVDNLLKNMEKSSNEETITGKLIQNTGADKELNNENTRIDKDELICLITKTTETSGNANENTINNKNTAIDLAADNECQSKDSISVVSEKHVTNLGTEENEYKMNENQVGIEPLKPFDNLTNATTKLSLSTSDGLSIERESSFLSAVPFLETSDDNIEFSNTFLAESESDHHSSISMESSRKPRLTELEKLMADSKVVFKNLTECNKRSCRLNLETRKTARPRRLTPRTGESFPPTSSLPLKKRSVTNSDTSEQNEPNNHADIDTPKALIKVEDASVEKTRRARGKPKKVKSESTAPLRISSIDKLNPSNDKCNELQSIDCNSFFIRSCGNFRVLIKREPLIAKAQLKLSAVTIGEQLDTVAKNLDNNLKTPIDSERETETQAPLEITEITSKATEQSDAKETDTIHIFASLAENIANTTSVADERMPTPTEEMEVQTQIEGEVTVETEPAGEVTELEHFETAIIESAQIQIETETIVESKGKPLVENTKDFEESASGVEGLLQAESKIEITQNTEEVVLTTQPMDVDTTAAATQEAIETAVVTDCFHLDHTKVDALVDSPYFFQGFLDTQSMDAASNDVQEITTTPESPSEVRPSTQAESEIEITQNTEEALLATQPMDVNRTETATQEAIQTENVSESVYMEPSKEDALFHSPYIFQGFLDNPQNFENEVEKAQTSAIPQTSIEDALAVIENAIDEQLASNDTKEESATFSQGILKEANIVESEVEQAKIALLAQHILEDALAQGTCIENEANEQIASSAESNKTKEDFVETANVMETATDIAVVATEKISECVEADTEVEASAGIQPESVQNTEQPMDLNQAVANEDAIETTSVTASVDNDNDNHNNVDESSKQSLDESETDIKQLHALPKQKYMLESKPKISTNNKNGTVSSIKHLTSSKAVPRRIAHVTEAEQTPTKQLKLDQKEELKKQIITVKSNSGALLPSGEKARHTVIITKTPSKDVNKFAFLKQSTTAATPSAAEGINISVSVMDNASKQPAKKKALTQAETSRMLLSGISKLRDEVQQTDRKTFEIITEANLATVVQKGKTMALKARKQLSKEATVISISPQNLPQASTSAKPVAVPKQMAKHTKEVAAGKAEQIQLGKNTKQVEAGKAESLNPSRKSMPVLAQPKKITSRKSEAAVTKSVPVVEQETKTVGPRKVLPKSKTATKVARTTAASSPETTKRVIRITKAHLQAATTADSPESDVTYEPPSRPTVGRPPKVYTNRKRKLQTTQPDEEPTSSKRAKEQSATATVADVAIETARPAIAFPIAITAAVPANLQEEPQAIVEAATTSAAAVVATAPAIAIQVKQIKCRKLRVRLNRSICKKWQLQQKALLASRAAAKAVPVQLTQSVCVPAPVLSKKPPVVAKAVPLPVPLPPLEVKTEPEAEAETEQQPQQLPASEAISVPQLVPIAIAAPVTAPPQPQRLTSSAIAQTPPSSSHIPSATITNDENTFGGTKLFSFLFPSRCQRSHGQVALDNCCPNLDGPMLAIDPTRLHSKVEAPVLELPQYIVITTKIISKQDKEVIPPKVRAKLEQLHSSAAKATAPATAAIDTPTATTTTPAATTTPTVDTPVCRTEPTQPSKLDRLSKQLPRGTTLTMKQHPPPTAASTAVVAPNATSLPPGLLQLPPICPTDKQRGELQTRVQLFDLVLQGLAQRASALSVAERTSIIESIVKTSTLLPIDVDVGTKLLENYVYYVNSVTNTVAPQTLPQRPAINTTPAVASGSNNSVLPLAKPAPSKVAIVGRQLPATTSSPSCLPPGKRPVYDKDKNIIGYQTKSSKPALSVTPQHLAASNSNSTPMTIRISTCEQLNNAQAQRLTLAGAPSSSNQTATARSSTGSSGLAMNLNTQRTTAPPQSTTTNAPRIPTVRIVSRAGPLLTSTPLTSTAVGAAQNNTRQQFFVNPVLSQSDECILPDPVGSAPAEMIKDEVEDIEIIE
ncbi:mucin-17 isoform X2 [Drosophila busckii]|uniref:mucin-17 isoform X2 n=1 Tax=Drosophila busckii TaxID=30019 RepID=UPI00083F4A72|nr:mucin-17 isoform X2 [Drosophila busckii]